MEEQERILLKEWNISEQSRTEQHTKERNRAERIETEIRTKHN